jgi:hypothetical protein
MSATDPTAGETTYEPMRIFAPYAGRTWRGRGANSTDVARWELILDGRALQITHRIADSTYGGRSIIFYDEGARAYVFHYFTTAGFHTLGSATVEGGVLEVTENVAGHPTVTQVRSRSHLQSGRISTSSEYLRSGTWEPGHSFVYEEAPEAVVGY